MARRGLCYAGRVKEGHAAAGDGLCVDDLGSFEGGKAELLGPSFGLDLGGQVAVDVAIGPLNVILGRLAQTGKAGRQRH